MKFVSSSNALLKQLQIINGVIGTRTVIPILEYFLFEVEDGTLTLTGTDLEVSMRNTMSVEARENGRIAVPSKYILDILKTLPEQPVTFTINPENWSIELTSENGKYKIAGENPDDFPKFPVVESASVTEIPASILSSAIATTSFSIGTDELRPAMTGLFFQMTPDELRFVATDGNKLVLYKRTDAKADKEEAFILPRKALNLLKTSLPSEDTNVRMEYNRLNAQFTFGNLTLVCRLIDERFPDYRAAIPVDVPNHLHINRNDLLNTLRRAVIFSNKSTNQVRFKINGSELTITAQDIDYNSEAVERLSCEYEGEDMEIGFNARFLIDMLHILSSEEVTLSLTAYNRPGVLKPSEEPKEEDSLMLLMPIVLNY
jgi:DNA polymerase-3 subunit beta